MTQKTPRLAGTIAASVSAGGRRAWQDPQNLISAAGLFDDTRVTVLASTGQLPNTISAKSNLLGYWPDNATIVRYIVTGGGKKSEDNTGRPLWHILNVNGSAFPTQIDPLVSGDLLHTSFSANVRPDEVSASLTSLRAIEHVFSISAAAVSAGAAACLYQIRNVRCQVEYGFIRAVTANRPGQTGGGGTNAWGTPQQVTANDSVYATQFVDGTAGRQSFLEVYGPVSGPADAIGVIGVEVNVCGKGSGTGTAHNYDTMQLIWNNVRSGENKASGILGHATNQQTEVRRSFGGKNDPWGNELSVADVQSSGFGFALRFAKGGASAGTVSVDSAFMVIYFEVPQTIAVQSYEHGFESRPESVPAPSEYGKEFATVALVQVHAISPARSEYGFDVLSSPRAFGLFSGNLARIAQIARESRIVDVVNVDRTITV